MKKSTKNWKTEFEMLRSCTKFKLNIRIRRSRCIFLYFYCLKIYFLRILNISKNIVVLELFREQNTAPLPNLTRLESGEALGSDIASFAPWVCGLRRAIAFQGDWDQLHGRHASCMMNPISPSLNNPTKGAAVKLPAFFLAK